MRDQPGVPRCFKPTKPAPSGLSPSYFSLAAAMVVKSSSEKRLGSGERLSSFSTSAPGDKASAPILISESQER